MHPLRNRTFQNEFGNIRPFDPVDKSHYEKPTTWNTLPHTKGLTSKPMKAGQTVMHPVPVFIKSDPRIPTLENALSYKWYHKVKEAGMLDGKKPAIVDYFAEAKKEKLVKQIMTKLAQKYTPHEIEEYQKSGKLSEIVRHIAEDEKNAQLSRGVDSRVVNSAFDDFDISNLSSLTQLQEVQHSDDYLDARALYEGLAERKNRRAQSTAWKQLMNVDEATGREGLRESAVRGSANPQGGTARTAGDEVYYESHPFFSLKHGTEFVGSGEHVGSRTELETEFMSKGTARALTERVQHSDRQALESQQKVTQLTEKAKIDEILTKTYAASGYVELDEYVKLKNAGYKFEKFTGIYSHQLPSTKRKLYRVIGIGTVELTERPKPK